MPLAPPNASFQYDRPPPGSTTDANSEHGSIDNGGPMDRVCASWVLANTPEGETVQALEQSGANAWSYENFGMPFTAPSLVASANSWLLTMFGTLACAYHGYARSGKTLPALGWGFLGGLFPLPTLTVALFSGYGQRMSRRRTVRA